MVLISYTLRTLELNIFQNKLKNSKEKKTITNTHKIQACDSIMSLYFCIKFIDFMLQGKSLFDYTNLFSHNEYEKNEKVILKHFQ